MLWSDFEQQQQFSPMGWLGGATMPPPPQDASFEDPSVVLARRMRQQSPNVPAVQRGEGGIGSDYPASVGMLSPAITGGRGIGSDRVAMDGVEFPTAKAGGSGSDYAASGGIGVPNVSPARIPTDTGSRFWSDFEKGFKRVSPPWWFAENRPGYHPGDALPGAAPVGRGVGSDYAGDQRNASPPNAPPAGQPVSVPMWSNDPTTAYPPNLQNLPKQDETVGAGAPADIRPPAQRQPQPQPAAQPSLLERIGNGLNNNSELLLSLGAGFAGAPSFGAGMQRAFTNARPLMGRNQTVEALIKQGMPEDMARAAVANPDILKQILPQFFGAKQRKFTQIGEDMLGNKKFGFVDEVTNRVYDLGGKEIAHSQQGSDIPTGPDGQPLQGDALRSHIAQIDPMLASAAKDMYEGKLNPNARNIQKIAPLVSLMYPGFDATQYPVRLATRKSYTSGKDFQEVQALNTVSGHMERLADAAEGLGNTGFKPWNYIKNEAMSRTVGSPALVKFRNDLVTTQNELAKAYHGGHVSDSAYAAFNKAIGEAQTPAELKTAIGEIAGLLKSKIEAKESGYRASMGDAPLPSEFRAINDEARHAFTKIAEWSQGIKPQAGAAPAAPIAGPAPASPPVALDPLSQARDAIARGASRDEVIKRLTANGINPAGL